MGLALEAAGPGAYAIASRAVGATARRSNMYFIAGAPRSGTAFLSQAMMHGYESFCFHEVERDITDAEDIGEVTSRTMEKMLSLRDYHRYVGNSSSGLVAFGQLAPEIPLVIIERPWPEIEESVIAACEEWGVPDYPYDTKAMLQMCWSFSEQNPHALKVFFYEVFTVRGLTKIWEHCCPSISPPIDNFREIVRHRITMKNFEYPWEPGRPWGIKSQTLQTTQV